MKSVISFLKSLYPSANKPFIVSVSGGIDSMVLLDVLLQNDFPLIVVFFNHQVRSQAIQEEKLVSKICQEHDIPFHAITLTIPKGNFQDHAHTLRQYHLRKLAQTHQTPYILTAHHLDDLLESVLIKLTRGSNLLGHAGMQQLYKKGGYVLVKPFLYVSKTDIVVYAKTHDIEYLDDHTNDENLYLRNRYRHSVIPLMKQENDDLLGQIKQYHQQLTNAFHFIRKQSKNHLKNNQIDLDVFAQLDIALQEDVIAYLLEQHQLEVNYQIITDLKKILLSNKPNQTYTLPRQKQLIKSYDIAYIDILEPPVNQVYQLNEGQTIIENVSIFTFFSNSSEISMQTTKLCYNKLAFPLLARRRLDGDTLSYSYGHKKLKKLLIDQKVPMKKRDQLWIVTDSNHVILWIPGYYINETLGDENALYFQIMEA